MRKWVLSLFFTVISAATVHGANVTVDGRAVVFADQPPALVEGRTLVPIRGVFEALGFEVAWDGDTDTAILTKGRDELRITIGSDTFTVNGERRALDVPARLIGGRTMIPIRLPLESVGYTVGWDDETNTVLITSAAEDAIVYNLSQILQLIPNGTTGSASMMTSRIHGLTNSGNFTITVTDNTLRMTNRTAASNGIDIQRTVFGNDEDRIYRIYVRGHVSEGTITLNAANDPLTILSVTAPRSNGSFEFTATVTGEQLAQRPFATGIRLSVSGRADLTIEEILITY